VSVWNQVRRKGRLSSRVHVLHKVLSRVITQEYDMTFACKVLDTDWIPFLNVRGDPATLQNETSLQGSFNR
jgi:hypothetical protein